jgi:ribonuclease VapC
MMVIETSAVVAIYKREPDSEQFLQAIIEADALVIPASCLLESVMVLSAFPSASNDIENLLEQHEISIAAIDGAVARHAVSAFNRYGRGARHPARLNFGDCLSYAVAKHLGAPLLYKGGDFIHTDIESALAA